MKPLLALALSCAAIVAAQSSHYTPGYTKDGQFLMPKDYRFWTFLTSGLNMSYPEEGAPKRTTFGNVFANPGAVQKFMEKGIWPDKTVLIVEIRDGEHDAKVQADARFQTNLLGFEAHVKDESHGGWAFYVIGKDSASGKPLPKTAGCFKCHARDAATDTTFVQYYPTLIEAAKSKGTFRPPQ